MTEKIYSYNVKIEKCPVCGCDNQINVQSEDSERDCVIRIIGRLKNHFRTCKERKENSKVKFEFTLALKKKKMRYNLVTYETDYVERKLIV
jgi:hypothetical protein